MTKGLMIALDPQQVLNQFLVGKKKGGGLTGEVTKKPRGFNNLETVSIIKICEIYGGIFLPLTCKMNYVTMRDYYAHMRPFMSTCKILNIC